MLKEKALKVCFYVCAGDGALHECGGQRLSSPTMWVLGLTRAWQ